MTDTFETNDFSISHFDIASLEDEIRVDGLCAQLLQHFHHELLNTGELSPEQAGEAARGADYFLRDFVIADRHENLLQLDPRRVRQFAGHWYIIQTLEPNMDELSGLLRGIEAFYRFCATHGLYPAEDAARVADQCRELAFYQQRIASFWAISDDGYLAWRQSCPLND